MMSNNKILTVSYGTFSCTLEGFDDSFGTMKAITEYFRDLASDDRYFGAEPVQPDAQMLASIAQKEISRRVEAREHDGNIVLSAAQESAAPAQLANTAMAATLVADAATDVVNEPAEANTDDAPSFDDSAISAALTEEAPAQEAPETAAPIAVSQEDSPIGAPANEDYMNAEEIAADPSIAVLRRAQATAVDTDINDVDIVPNRDDAEVSSFFAQSEMVAQVEDDILPEALDVAEIQQEVVDTPPSQSDASPVEEIAPIASPKPESPRTESPKTESIADKLQRIREVVAQNGSEDDDADAEQNFEASEALAADKGGSEDAAKDDDTILSALRDIKGAIAADDAAEEEQIEDQPSEVAEDDTDLSGILESLKQQSSGDARELADDANLDDAEVAAKPESAQEADVAAEPELAQRDIVTEEDAQPETTQEAEEDAAERAPRAEEADLAQELAELEADLDFDAEQEDGAEDEAITEALESAADIAEDTTEDAASAAREMLPPIDEGQNPDMNRLMEETDQQMSEPENTTRRNAFAHLRAAVAAKKADVALGGNKDDEAEGDAYREDLAEVVRPRRPVSGEQRTPRPAAARPAPLKLVAEQRIDTDTPADVTPVRPRRVAAVQEEAESQAEESFAEFAAEAGATSLPDLLEAAAAYMSFVEGRAQFSRPQLMNKVRQVEQDGFTREDSLRLFGKLLRDGKIEKTNAGRFQVSDQIGFRPDARAVG
jgi:hypothetical protein